MGFLIRLEDEQGSEIEAIIDPTSVLIAALVRTEHSRFPVLWQIDWEGNTDFNHLQAAYLQDELRRLRDDLKDSGDLSFIDSLDELVSKTIDQCLHLKFYGD